MLLNKSFKSTPLSGSLIESRFNSQQFHDNPSDRVHLNSVKSKRFFGILRCNLQAFKKFYGCCVY